MPNKNAGRHFPRVLLDLAEEYSRGIRAVRELHLHRNFKTILTPEWQETILTC
jgi:hypothetical protein